MNVIERFTKCTNLSCGRWIPCAPGDVDGPCAVCARAALAAMRETWLQTVGERNGLRAELEALTCERDDLVLELEREREAHEVAGREFGGERVGTVVLGKPADRVSL